MSRLTVDQLPDTGVQISVVIFGALTLLILGAGIFLAGRRHRRPPPPPDSDLLSDLILARKSQKGFRDGPIGQASEEGGESGPPRH